jgi:hypothetical protein
MGGIRNFAEQEGHPPLLRQIDNNVPAPMRQELLAVIYDILPLCGAVVTEQQIYYGIEQMLGVQAAGNPMAGWRQRLGRDLGNTEWVRIYDVIGWTWSQFQRAGLQEVFRENINRVLAAHAVVWDLGEDGRLHRVLPIVGQGQIVAAFAELAAPRYAPALALANAARDAYNARPRRDRDACSNIFDALESVAKEKFGMPHATFGQVVAHIRQRQGLNEQIIGLLESSNTLRNRNFGHGMVAPFSLTGQEVDVTYLTCIGAVLLLSRTP